MEISSNLTLEILNQPFLLEKRIALLLAIKEFGSISKAAKEVPLSYKAAWETIENMNNLASTPIVEKETGGIGGGGTKLTQYGENLVQTYMILKNEQKKFLENLNRMTNIENGTLKDIRRFSMQISARNQIVGKVINIEKGNVNSQVTLELKSGCTIVSVITNSAVENLDLKVENEVIAIFKSSNVLISTDTSLNISARNQFFGVVDFVNQDEVNCEVLIDIGNTDKIASVITTNSAKNLNLEVGTKVCAVIKSSDVMIGK